MVATRRSAADQASVELNRKGKMVEKIITSSPPRSDSIPNREINKYNNSSSPVETTTPELNMNQSEKKKETRGRKRKSSELVSATEVQPILKIETRGRKRKNPVNTVKQEPTTSPILKKPSFGSLAENQINNKHNILHLLTDDNSLPPPPPPPPPPAAPASFDETMSPSSSAVISNGRIPITSIISQKIDTNGPDDLTPLSGSPAPESPDSGSLSAYSNGSDKKTKRRYRVDRDNIKINKRIMSKDTEDVIAMFKKFDDEVLTNTEAKQRLLSLGFETRKRYITTFKHYIRFCCKKNLSNFFVTGELMKEFYEEQFAMSSSTNPVIRLRKMDPAFSKLQEINFLVYHLPTKEIPNRHIALEYLIYKEGGNESGAGLQSMKSSAKSSASPAPVETIKKKLTAPNTKKKTVKVQTKKKAAVENRDETALMTPPEHSETHPFPDHIATPKTETSSPIPTPIPTKKPSNKKQKNLDVKELRSSFNVLRSQIQNILKANVSIEPAAISNIATQINRSLDEFDHTLTTPTVLGTKAVPTIDINHDIFTVYEICEEWFRIEPSIESRLQKWGEDWITDEIDHATFLERKAIVEFVQKMSKECGVDDIFIVANDCDRYIRDKSILDEFISEIELDFNDLFKRVIRHRQRRS